MEDSKGVIRRRISKKDKCIMGTLKKDKPSSTKLSSEYQAKDRAIRTTLKSLKIPKV